MILHNKFLNPLYFSFFILSISISYGQSADALIELAEEELSKNHLEKAYSNFEVLIKSHKEELSLLQLANIYNNLGYLNIMLHDLDHASKNLLAAVSYHERDKISNAADYSHALNNLAQVYIELGDYNLAQEYIEKSIQVLEDENVSDTELALANVKLGLLHEEVGSFQLAMKMFTESYKVISESQITALSPELAELCLHVGRILIRNGFIAESESYIEESFSIYEQLGKDYDLQYAEALEELGIFFERLGNFSEAENFLLEALELKKSIPNEPEILIIESINNLGVLYFDYSNFGKAKSMFNEVIERCRNSVGTEHQNYAIALNNLASIAIFEKEYSKARIFLSEGLDIYKTKFGKFHPFYANALNNLARVERAEGNMKKAEDYYLQCLDIDEKIYGRNHPDYATTLVNLAVLNSITGQLSQAEKYYQEALKIREITLGKDHQEYGKTLDKLGLHHLMLGDMVLAEQYFRKSLKVQLKLIKSTFPVMTEIERAEFYKSIKDVLDRYNYIAMELLDENPDLLKNIFDFQMKTKAILFNSISKVRDNVKLNKDPLLKNLFELWQSKKKSLANYYQMSLLDLQNNDININDIETELESLEKQLVRAIDGFQNVIQNDEKNWQSVQSKVKRGEAIIEMIRVREFKASEKRAAIFGFTDFTQYLAIIFTDKYSEPQYKILGGYHRTDVAHYAQYKNAMLYGVSQTNTYDVFWKPIEEVIGEVKRVKVSPDGIFHKMNLNAVEIPDNNYLVDKYFISYMTSCKDLFRPKIETHTKKGYFFGNPLYGVTKGFQLKPLPGSEKEVKTISNICKKEKWTTFEYLQNEATELSIRKAESPEIMHIATHGFFGEKGNFLASLSPINNPLFKAGIYLSGVASTYSKIKRDLTSSPENDGILTAYEAMNLNLDNTKLVILSACESGLGEIENGEGVYGLQRAFMVAGARNIITSFIKIDDDATSKFMVSFYKKFVETEKVDESLRYAQIKLKEKLKDPKIWGAFILTGS